MGIFGGEKKGNGHGAVDSVLGEKAKFKGELISAGAVSISGEFEGKIASEDEVIICRGSHIVGDVSGGNVVISGRVDGNITALHGLEITKSGRVHGDLTGGKIIIEDGSSYRGKVKVETGAGSEDLPKKDAAVGQIPAF